MNVKTELTIGISSRGHAGTVGDPAKAPRRTTLVHQLIRELVTLHAKFFVLFLFYLCSETRPVKLFSPFS